MGILARRLAEIRTAWLDQTRLIYMYDSPPKRTKTVQLGIIIKGYIFIARAIIASTVRACSLFLSGYI